MMNFKMLIILIVISLGLGIVGCDYRLKNEGTTIVENGKGEKEKIPFDCIGCVENLDHRMFDRIINESSDKVMSKLNIPLSFRPISIDLYVYKEDSLFRFDTNEKIEGVLNIRATYKYIAQNYYGTELSGEQSVRFTLVNGRVEDISEVIKLDDLQFYGENKIIDRYLSLQSRDEFIQLIPLDKDFFVVLSNFSCVSEKVKLKIELENGEKIEMTSFNDFNCDGEAYFEWFSKSDINKLKDSKIELISLHDINSRKFQCNIIHVPKNQRDYIQQLIYLYQPSTIPSSHSTPNKSKVITDITEKTIKASNTSILGDGMDYIKVVDDYMVKSIGDKIVIDITFELIKKFEGDGAMGNLNLRPLEGSGVSVMSDIKFKPSTMSDYNKVRDLLRSEVGKTTTLRFELKCSPKLIQEIIKKNENCEIVADFTIAGNTLSPR